MNLEKAGVATVCLITTAFQSVAEAQQRALGYPALPFVMLEHPVAVATDEEVERKLEAVYAEVVGKLTGGPAGAGARTEAPAAGLDPVWEEALAPIREMLRADGADLAVTGVENGTVHMRLVFSEAVCEECILPREDLAGMILAACRDSGGEISRVVLEDPREEAGVDNPRKEGES